MPTVHRTSLQSHIATLDFIRMYALHVLILTRAALPTLIAKIIQGMNAILQPASVRAALPIVHALPMDMLLVF